MKALSHLLVLSLLILTFGCRNHQSPYDIEKSFWPPIEKESDSLVALLNAKAVHTIYDPADTVIANRIYQIGVEQNNKQIIARGLFWIANVQSRYGIDSTLRSYAIKAAELCDTVAYSYDYARFRTFFPYQLLTFDENFRYNLMAVKEFEKCNDSIEYAVKLCRLATLMETTGDSATALENIKKVTEIMKRLNAKELAATTAYRLHVAYFVRGQFDKAYYLIDTLLSNEYIKNCNNLYQVLELNYYSKNHNPAYLIDALHRCDSAGNPTLHKPHILAVLAQHYGERNQTDSMLYYKYLLYDNWDKLGKSQFDIYKIMINIMNYENKSDSAQMFRNQTDLYETYLKNKNKRARAESLRRQEMLSQFELENSRYKEAENRNSISIIAIATLCFILVLCIFMLAYFKLKRTKKLSIIQQRRSALSQIKVAEKERAIAEIVESVKDDKANVEKVIAQIRAGLTPESDWRRVELLFAEINPEFTERLRKLYPTLSPAEHRLACLVYLGLDNKHIARLLAIAPDSVKKTRQRLRAKLPIGPKDDLHQFLDSII